jgi:hypothetical protein
MRDDGILPGDVVVVQKQDTARNGQTVIALLNGEATIKTYHRKAGMVEVASGERHHDAACWCTKPTPFTLKVLSSASSGI